MFMPGAISSVAMPRMAGAVMMRRVIRIASSVTSRSSWALKKLKRIAGGVLGAAEDTWILPVLSERRIFMIAVTPEFLASCNQLAAAARIVGHRPARAAQKRRRR